MTTLKFKANSKQSFNAAWQAGKEFFLEHKYIHIVFNDKRSLDQNAAIRVAYKQIKDSWEGMTSKDIERHCKLNYGAPILAEADEDFGRLMGWLKDDYSYEDLLKVMDSLQVTSHDSFSTAMAGEMIESMIADFPFIKIEKQD